MLKIYSLSLILWLTLLGQYSPPIIDPTVTPTPTRPAPITDSVVLTHTTWYTFTSPHGYQLQYPSQFTWEKRADTLSVLLADKDDPWSILFAITDQQTETLAIYRAQTLTSMTATMTDVQMAPWYLSQAGLQGFVTEGRGTEILSEDMYIKEAYLYFNGQSLVFSCFYFCQNPYLFDQILATFRLTLSPQPTTAPPADLAVDPHNPQVAYALMPTNTLYRTANGGQSWQKLSSPVPEVSPLEHYGSVGSTLYNSPSLAITDHYIFAHVDFNLYRSADILREGIN